MKIRLIGILILLTGFAFLRFRDGERSTVDVPEIDAVPQLEPEYTVNLPESSAQ